MCEVKGATCKPEQPNVLLQWTIWEEAYRNYKQEEQAGKKIHGSWLDEPSVCHRLTSQNQSDQQ